MRFRESIKLDNLIEERRESFNGEQVMSNLEQS